MTLTERQREYLESKNLFAILATINPDGTAQQTVMWYELHGDTIVMNTKAGRVKSHNLERDQRVSICVPNGDRYITITGTAELDPNPEVGHAGIRRLAERYSEETDPIKREVDVAQQMETFLRQARVQITVPIEHVIEWGF
jgi:PPOX class probable F420-dependent enzyme